VQAILGASKINGELYNPEILIGPKIAPDQNGLEKTKPGAEVLAEACCTHRRGMCS